MLLSALRREPTRKPHIADRMLLNLVALPAATDLVVAAAGLVFAAYGHYIDRSPVESMVGLGLAGAFACLALFALMREMRLVRVLEHHRKIDLEKLDRYELEQLAIALFRVRGYQVAACQNPVRRQAADLELRRGKTITLVRLRDWDDDQVGLGAVRSLRAAVAESGATSGTLLHRCGYSAEAWEFGRAKGLALLLRDDLRNLLFETLGEPAAVQSAPPCPAGAKESAAIEPTAIRQLLFLDLRLLDHAEGITDWFAAHPDVELVATTEREDALGRIAAFDPRLSSRFAGSTPELPTGSAQRFFEIQAYLAQQGLHGSKASWVAIDTHANAFPGGAPGLLVASAVDHELLQRVARCLEEGHA